MKILTVKEMNAVVTKIRDTIEDELLDGVQLTEMATFEERHALAIRMKNISALAIEVIDKMLHKGG